MNKKYYLVFTIVPLFIIFTIVIQGGIDFFSLKNIVSLFEWITTYILPWILLVLLFKLLKK